MIYLCLLIVTVSIIFLQIGFFQFIHWEAKQDFKAIEADGSKNSLGRTWHRQSWLRVAGICAIPCLLYAYFLSWQIGASLLLVMGAEWWIWFDRFLNRLRGKALLYVGFTAEVDRLFRRHWSDKPEKAMLWAKVLLLGVSVGLLGWCLCLYFINNQP